MSAQKLPFLGRKESAPVAPTGSTSESDQEPKQLTHLYDLPNYTGPALEARGMSEHGLVAYSNTVLEKAGLQFRYGSIFRDTQGNIMVLGCDPVPLSRSENRFTAYSVDLTADPEAPFLKFEGNPQNDVTEKPKNEEDQELQKKKPKAVKRSRKLQLSGLYLSELSKLEEEGNLLDLAPLEAVSMKMLLDNGTIPQQEQIKEQIKAKLSGTNANFEPVIEEPEPVHEEAPVAVASINTRDQVATPEGSNDEGKIKVLDRELTTQLEAVHAEVLVALERAEKKHVTKKAREQAKEQLEEIQQRERVILWMLGNFENYTQYMLSNRVSGSAPYQRNEENEIPAHEQSSAKAVALLALNQEDSQEAEVLETPGSNASKELGNTEDLAEMYATNILVADKVSDGIPPADNPAENALLEYAGNFLLEAEQRLNAAREEFLVIVKDNRLSLKQALVKNTTTKALQAKALKEWIEARGDFVTQKAELAVFTEGQRRKNDLNKQRGEILFEAYAADLAAIEEAMDTDTSTEAKLVKWFSKGEIAAKTIALQAKKDTTEAGVKGVLKTARNAGSIVKTVMESPELESESSADFLSYASEDLKDHERRLKADRRKLRAKVLRGAAMAAVATTVIYKTVR